MNHVFRIIWSVSRGAFVVVSELASSRGKRNQPGSGLLASLPGIFLLTPICAALSINSVFAAGVQVASGNTQVFNAPNGVQVIDIATANAAGVSHNRYVQYNVDPSGQILNNNSALTKAGALQSQLGGQIVANVNLTNEAKVILNEVVAPNRSSLQGYTEVVGGKADVIVANPYGITCSGCGFINSDHATLTTGVPTLGADGRLAGFSVDQGDILIEGKGLDARNQLVLDLVARSLKIDGQVNGQDVGVVAGSNDFDYAQRSVRARSPSGDTPLFAIDSTALGGMYANRIRLLATENGVGVRMRGEVAASGDDFTLTASGKIELDSSISAQQDIAIDYVGSAADSDAISLNGSQARLSAKRDIRVSAVNGAGVTLQDGALNASRDLSLSADRLSDSSSGGVRFGGRNVSLDTTATSWIDGSSWGAGNDLSLDVGNLQIGANGATLYSGSAQEGTRALNVTSRSGDIDLANASLQSGGTLQLDSAGRLNLASAGSIKSSGNLTLTAGGIIDQAGTLQSGADASVSASRLNNSGSLKAAGSLTLGSAERALALNNQGSLQAGGSLTGTLSSLDNGSTSNSAATLLAATSSGSGVLNVSGTLNNYASLHSNADLQVQAANLYNSATAGLSALGTLSLTARSGDIDNYGALYAGKVFCATADHGSLRNRSGATLDSSGSFTSHSDQFINNGAVVIVGNGDITTTTAFVNQTLYNGAPIVKAWGDAVEGSVSSVEIAHDGAFSDGMNADLYNQQITRTEYFVGLTAAQVQALPKAQLIANGAGSSLSIHYGGSGLNDGGVISASTLNIGGSGTFTNQDLVLYKYDLIRRWIGIEDGGHHTYWARIDSDPKYSCYWNNPTPSCTGKDDSGPNGPDDDDWNWDSWTPGGSAWKVGEGWKQYSSEGAAKSASTEGAAFVGATTVASTGAGLFASTLNFTSGTLDNIGSPWPDDQSKVKQGASVAAQVNAVGASASVPGLGLSLPSNPNGYYVTSKDPNAKYLVETNPNFAVGSDFVGSDYLAKRYGYNPDDVQKRLGDANYEAYLIRQQLIQLTGNNVIAGYDNEAAQMQKLMDQGYDQGQALGLEFGKALTAEQAASLTQDIVWMEEVEVDGQKVLAPRVYLAAATLASLDSGAVIAADNLNISGDALNNTGGTLQGRDSLQVKTTGDVTNSSGTLKGGDVSVTSSEGSIRNETVAITGGDAASRGTAIGKTASIQADGNLDLDAAKDISIKGADVSAKGDASLAAGGNVTVDTIVDSRADTNTTRSGGFLGGSTTTVNVQTETNIGSNLSTGGNLKIKSGGDTVIAGSQANVGGNLDVDSGGDFRVEARQDKATTTSVTSTSGVGVGGGLYGTQKTTQTDFTGTNVGSTLNVGGNTDVKAEKSMVIQGSDVNIGGNANLDAKQGISVLDGLDEKSSSTRTETTTFLKVDHSSGAEASAGAAASAGKGGANASAEAGASANASANLKLAETSVTTTHDGKTTSVASNLKVGGNLDMRSEGTVTVQGSNVEAGGDLKVQAKDVQVLTGRNETWHDSETTSTSVGLYNEAGASAKASASAGASSSGVASANAEAGAEAGSTSTLGVRHEHSEESSYQLTNSSSTLKAGGNLSVKAQDSATFQGANVESGGDMDIQATNIRNVAAQDISTSSSSSSTQTAGVYLGTSASAKASASGSSQGKSEAEASASAEASAGLRVASESEQNSEGSVTQVTNSFKSGGNFTRQAQDTITDQGTQVEAAGDITQTARAIHDEAVSDSSWSSSASQSHDARVGVYAGAEASASAGGGSDTSAGVGLKASYEGSISSEKSAESTAVTSRFKAGGNIASTSKDETNLVGTQFESGGDTTLQAGSLDYQAAHDTSSASSSSHDINVEAKVSESDASLEGGYEMSTSKDSSSTARTGSIQAGGNLSVRTTGDANFEGTDLAAGGKASVAAGGNLNMSEARDTASSSEAGLSISASTSSSKGEGGSSEKESELGLGGGYSTSSSSTAKVGSISGGQGVSISSGKDTTLVGTQISSGADTSIAAGGQVKQQEAVSTSSSFGIQAETSLSASSKSEPAAKSSGTDKAGSAKPAATKNEAKDDDEDSPIGGSGLDIQADSSREATGVNIQSAGKVSIQQNQR
ncbi:MAG: 16S rRNA endonuclease CdiA [Pseudomonas citronellolis]|nr:MAG: 16S rRNA endonuclease CdiA [Pseudomonas citronellolis]